MTPASLALRTVTQRRTRGQQLPLAAALALLPTPAAADALQQQLLAGMRATDTRDVSFTRTTRVERTGAAPKTYVARYDPRTGLTLVSSDGKPPSDKERREAAKEEAPGAGYAKLAKWFGGTAARTEAGPGRVVYRFARLPAGTFKLGSRDMSADVAAEATVDTSGPRPWVRHVRMTSQRPVRMMLVAKLDRIVADSRYRLLADGRPFPAGHEVQASGSLMGKAGSLTTRTLVEAGRP